LLPFADLMTHAIDQQCCDCYLKDAGPGPSGGMCRDVGPHRSELAIAPSEWTREEHPMINPISTNYVAMRLKRRGDEPTHVIVEVKKPRRKQHEDREDRPGDGPAERGRRA
jgi:hypothetical protein